MGKTRKSYGVVLVVGVALMANNALAQTTNDHSIARQWNEVLLEAIRNDQARPTVHALSLIHI